MDWEQTEKSQEADFLQELSEEIGNVGNNAVDIEFYESRRFPKDKFRELYRIYETEKKKYRKLDFEDMLSGVENYSLKDRIFLQSGRKNITMCW